MKAKLCMHLGALVAPLAAVALFAAPESKKEEIRKEETRIVETTEEKKARVARENLEKYDENKDGKLDRVETAVMRLDQARAAASIAAAKKKAAEEKKTAAAAKKMSAAERKKAADAAKPRP